MIKIFSYPATRGVRITWACEELGLDYDYNVVNLYKGEHKQPAYLAITPTGKVPAIQDGDLVLAESGAIVTYLADKAQKLIPTVPSAERALFDQCMYFVLTELEQPLWTMAKHKFAYPEEKRIEQVVGLGQWEFEKALNIFSDLLGDKTYLLGDDFSVVDIIAGHTLSWAQGFKQNLGQENVAKYAARVLERPALARAREKEQAAKDAIA
ncbi:glutathione S-transferase family protein [Glaciecola siphonariae]|uniref:Glutathione S-transferase family protein n=1 Tax=Glaciecola siphonariae TaxID=521012 RepID=A0ABV9LW22_9ALTE